LFGFCYCRAIGRQDVWRFVFIAMVVIDAISLQRSFEHLDVVETDLFGASMEGLLTLGLLIPQYWALFHYAFREPEIWSSPGADAN
ncbi:MAG: hypothetical protein K0U93_21680, partial [Gammaproteobacteria bacterium]|nr:hypothetical protein [Gammaproteobacteria bacterium]